MRIPNYLKLLDRIEELESIIPQVRAIQDSPMLERINAELADLQSKRKRHEDAMEATQS